MVDVNALHGELTAYVTELAEKFVDRHIPADPSAPPDTYAYEVKAYCILSHAAFEEFIEAAALGVADYATKQWLSQRKVSDVIIALLCCHGVNLNISDKDNPPKGTPFDYLCPVIENAKASFSKVIHKNHGVSIPYLRSLLIPVAIEITQDVTQLDSLMKLAEGRGNYAHKGRVKGVLAPEDAKQYVQDVLALCDDIRAKAMGQIEKLA
jgi:hypothetical protein